MIYENTQIEIDQWRGWRTPRVFHLTRNDISAISEDLNTHHEIKLLNYFLFLLETSSFKVALHNAAPFWSVAAIVPIALLAVSK